MADRTGVLAVYAEIRERWQTRGLDCWTDDPTSSGGDGWLCVAELDADPERLDERLGAFSDRVETAQPKAAPRRQPGSGPRCQLDPWPLR